MSVAPFILRKVYVYGRKVHEIAILQECGAVIFEHNTQRCLWRRGNYRSFGNIHKFNGHFKLHFVIGTQVLEKPEASGQCHKKQKEIQKFRNSLEPGMEVVTYGGLHGTIKEIDDAKNIVILEIARDVKVKVEKTHLFANAAATQQVR